MVLRRCYTHGEKTARRWCLVLLDFQTFVDQNPGEACTKKDVEFDIHKVSYVTFIIVHNADSLDIG